MPKAKAVLVSLNRKFLVNALTTLNHDKVSLYAAFAEDGDGKSFTVGKIKVQVLPFSLLSQVVEVGQNFLWLICGRTNDVDDVARMKSFLVESGVPEDSVVNFTFADKISPARLGNLRAAEEGLVDSFATGDESAMYGLDFKRIPEIVGANLSTPGQDLRQSFRIARHVFDNVPRGKIKFVFIGLTPYSLLVDSRKNFSTCTDDLRYALALNETFRATTAHDKFLAALTSNVTRGFFANITSAKSDLNYDRLRTAHDEKISVGDVTGWQTELARLTKPFDAATVEENLRVLEDYVRLCIEHGAKPVGVIFPFAPIISKNYPRESLLLLRSELRRLEGHGFSFVDMFDAATDYTDFSDMTTLNLRGAVTASRAIDFHLRGKDFLPHDKISRLNYAQIFAVSNFLPAEDFNACLERHFAAVVKNLRGKKKIRVGFVSDDPSMWCGDKLFNLFAHNKHCETTFFLCLQKSFRGQQTMLKDFRHGFDDFKARGINVVAVTDDEQTAPAQDVLIFLRPYFHYLPKAFALSSISAQTLMAYIPYGFNMTNWNIYDTPIYHLGWKLFFDTREHIKLLQRECRTGMPRGLYSGYTKLDVFFEKGSDLTFDWKTTRPDSKKIIWAPHWSISSGIRYATFAWNYRFMYEFAKAHPEISWVLKPHPMLLASAVGHGVFPSTETFEAYLQAWNDLPNAKVFTGPYYQGLFATSDGMIMDCGSWIGEYQYTHKPMIFLTRDTQEFNELGNALMKILYRVDGKNLQGIAKLMQKVFIDGNDDMFSARMKFFDEHMNYVKANGVTAAQFIFKTLAKELRL
ncbi:MAG: hypothetical protein SR2Q5_05225 [Quinella sp. 2Q5]|nr:hypothetical protein [Quinella sp. 2Q5]